MPARSDDQVIYDRYPKEPARRDRVPGGPEVVGRRLGVAGRMVVGQHDPRGVAAEGLGEELADAHGGPGDIAHIDRTDGDEPLLPGQQGHHEGLPVSVRQVRREGLRGRARGIEDRTVALGGKGPATELERRDDPGGGRWADARVLESGSVGPREPAGPADRMEQGLPERDRGAATGT